MNQAVDHSQMKQWLQQREMGLSGIQVDWVRSEESFQARGGAFFLALRNRREDSSANILLLDVSAKENFAAVGGTPFLCSPVAHRTLSGAMYVEDKSSGAITHLCPDKELNRQRCLSLSIVGVDFSKNVASVAGGGLFVHGSKSLDAYGCSATPSFSGESSKHTCADFILRLRGNRILVSNR